MANLNVARTPNRYWPVFHVSLTHNSFLVLFLFPCLLTLAGVYHPLMENAYEGNAKLWLDSFCFNTLSDARPGLFSCLMSVFFVSVFQSIFCLFVFRSCVRACVRAFLRSCMWRSWEIYHLWGAGGPWYMLYTLVYTKEVLCKNPHSESDAK